MNKYNTLEITFKDGGTRVYKSVKTEWYDWDMLNGFVVVKDMDGKWIGIYNCDSIKSVEMYEGGE